MGVIRGRVSQFIHRASDESIQADVVGSLYILGGILCGVSILLPGPSEGQAWIELIMVTAFVTGGLLIAYAKRITHLAVLLLVAFGSVLINLLMLAADVAAGIYAGMFCWVVLVSVNFFTPRMALAQFVWAMAGYAAVLALVESGGGYSPITRWLAAVFALGVTGLAGLWLVTRRRLAERATRQFIYLSREMLCSIDEEGRFINVNPSWRTALGYSEAELRSRPVSSLVQASDRLELELAFARLRNGGEAREIDNTLRTRSGGWKPMRWEIQYADDEQLLYARVRERRRDEIAEGAPDDDPALQEAAST